MQGSGQRDLPTPEVAAPSLACIAGWGCMGSMRGSSSLCRGCLWTPGSLHFWMAAGQWCQPPSLSGLLGTVVSTHSLGFGCCDVLLALSPKKRVDSRDAHLVAAPTTPSQNPQAHFHSDQGSFAMQLGFYFYPVIFLPPRFNLDEKEQRHGMFALCSINGACGSAVSALPSRASQPPS